jgi:hypothetical protein
MPLRRSFAMKEAAACDHAMHSDDPCASSQSVFQLLAYHAELGELAPEHIPDHCLSLFVSRTMTILPARPTRTVELF